MNLRFYFDILSPYSYLAWCWLRENREMLEQHAHVSLVPVTLAPLIKANDTKGPAEIESKRDYLMKDCLRTSRIHNIPFQAPPSLPFNSLYVQRISLKECCAEKQWEVIDLFYRAAWQDSRDLGKAEVVEAILAQAGMPAKEWLDMVGDKGLRAALKRNTKEAIDRGIFGLPSFLVDNGTRQELFWGNDSIPYLKLFLEDKDPLDTEALKKFRECYLTLDA